MVSRPSTLRLTCALVLGLALLWTGVVVAQSRERILHEYFTLAGGDEIGGASSSDSARGDEAGDQEDYVPSRRPGDPPSLSLGAGEDEPVLDTSGMVSSLPMKNPQGALDPLSATNTLDSNTDRVDELNYFSSFEPSVIPYKRAVAQNRVEERGGVLSFSVDSGRWRRIEVSGSEARSREDLFWGSFLIRATPGTRHPLPSVAPTQRIIEVQTEPRVDLVFDADEADNHYVRLDHEGLVRLNIKIAAPRFYFDGAFDEEVVWRQVRRMEGGTRLSQGADIPADQVLSRLGVDPRRMTPHDALIELVEHFRDFEARPFPPELGGGKPLSRHRSAQDRGLSPPRLCLRHHRASSRHRHTLRLQRSPRLRRSELARSGVASHRSWRRGRGCGDARRRAKQPRP